MSGNLQIVEESSEDELSLSFTGRKDSFLRPLDTATLLKPLMWREFELSRMAAGWMPATNLYIQKVGLGRLSYLHSQHTKYLHDRLNELPGSLNENSGTPSDIKAVYEQISLTPSFTTFLISYQYLIKKQFHAYDELLSKLDPILDAPTIDQINKIFIDRTFINNWINEQIQTLQMENQGSFDIESNWKTYISSVWNHKSAIYDHSWGEPVGPVPETSVIDREFKTVTYEEASMIYKEAANSPLYGGVKQMIYVNSTEIIAAEQLAYMYYSVTLMPLAFYYDTSRHMWDEVRHSQMGVRRFEQLGYTVADFKFFPSLKIDPEIKVHQLIENYFSLTNVAEACSFPYKREAAQSFWKFGDALSAIQTEFDIVDERMHVDFGNKWGPELYKSIHHEVITAKKIAEKARETQLRHIKYDENKLENTAKSFPVFCGVVDPVALKFDNY